MGSLWTFLKTETSQLFVPVLGCFWLLGFFCSYSKRWNNTFFTKSAKVLLKRNVIWSFLNFGQSSTIICWNHQMHYFLPFLKERFFCYSSLSNPVTSPIPTQKKSVESVFSLLRRESTKRSNIPRETCCLRCTQAFKI